jgi:GT2 family glycosyltransferase
MTLGVPAGATVVVPTFRRPASLRRGLRALIVQKDPGVAWDVVVVDNDPGSAHSVVDEVARESAVAIRVVDEAVAGSAAARNRGIEEAAGEVTVFLDDDVVANDVWLGALLAPILAGRCDATGGRVVLDPAVRRPQWFDEAGIGGYLTAFDPATEERDVIVERGEFVVTANAAFTTARLRETGGFRADLGPRPGAQLVNDDVLLTRRYAAGGGRVRFAPSAVVVHELPAVRLRRSYLLRRAHAQGRSDWRLDADELRGRRLAGARVPASWLQGELGRRWRERPWSAAVAFHVACDVARAAGGIREAVAASVGRRE